jgi:hypothetical protein
MTEETSRRGPTPRPFDTAFPSGLAAGELGVVTAQAGVGKTACLVQIALAELLQGRTALHVALDMTVSQVRQWYDRLFQEAGRRGLTEGSESKRMDLERRRHIHSYPQKGFDADRLSGALAFLGDTLDFRPQVVVVDGYPFDQATGDEIQKLADSAAENRIPLWLTALAHRDAPVDRATGLPEPLEQFAPSLSVVLQLTPSEKQVVLRLLKDRDAEVPRTLPVRLDPTSLLLFDA